MISLVPEHSFPLFDLKSVIFLLPLFRNSESLGLNCHYDGIVTIKNIGLMPNRHYGAIVPILVIIGTIAP